MAYEIKWRDATTDGDHIIKEHARLKCICSHGYKPVRLMFYSPNRSKAIKIQEILYTIYKGVHGEYYSGTDTWEYIKNLTGIDLFFILTNIANEKY